MEQELKEKTRTLRKERDSYEALANEWKIVAEERRQRLETLPISTDFVATKGENNQSSSSSQAQCDHLTVGSSVTDRDDLYDKIEALEENNEQMYQYVKKLEKENQKWEKENINLNQNLNSATVERKSKAKALKNKKRNTRKPLEERRKRDDRNTLTSSKSRAAEKQSKGEEAGKDASRRSLFVPSPVKKSDFHSFLESFLDQI